MCLHACVRVFMIKWMKVKGQFPLWKKSRKEISLPLLVAKVGLQMKPAKGIH